MTNTGTIPKFSPHGLEKTEVERSRAKNGNNLFTKQKRKSFLRKYTESFSDPIIRILLVALAVNVFFAIQTGDILETVGVALAVFLSTFVSTLSEYGSETAFLRLQAEAEKLTCRVKRGGTLTEIPIGEVVAGDLVLLEAGEKIPADGILVSGFLGVDESTLNGESKEAKKEGGTKLFRGTLVTDGEGMMLVETVGDHTLYGKLAGELQGDNTESPMKARLAHLAGQIARLGYTAAFLVAFADLFHALVIENGYVLSEILLDLQDIRLMAGHLVHALLIAISVIVVAVPEGLPMMITIVLSSNVGRMERAGVMVKRLVGIETAGSLNILFTDKTGTLTKGDLSVETIVMADTTFSSFDEIQAHPRLSRLMARSLICNGTAALSKTGAPIGNNATERALVAFARPAYHETAGLVKERSVPFDSTKKYAWSRLAGEHLVLVKGAPELLLPRCVSHYDKNGEIRSGVPNSVRGAFSEMTEKAMRVLLLAVCDRNFDEKGAKLIFLALVGIRDGLREEAREAVAIVKKAGIQTVIVTGDNPKTAMAIGREAGILSGISEELVLTGSELSAMSDEEIARELPHFRIIARALPQDKSRLVRIAKEKGLVVGMTGDGVNDAPALKLADVGFAMGSGTEIAKDAGDIVITDNNFASIVRAVLFGRTIFHSIRKFIVFQLMMNFCAVCISFFGPFIGIEMPVTVTQMLWINIIMDTLAGLAFAGEAPQKSYMEEAPKSRKEPIITGEMTARILLAGGYSVALLVSFLVLPYFREMFGYEEDQTGFLTAFFTLFVFLGVFNAVNARTSRLKIWTNISKNPLFVFVLIFIFSVQIALIFFGGEMFRTVPLPLEMIGKLALMGASVVVFDLIRKVFARIFAI